MVTNGSGRLGAKSLARSQTSDLPERVPCVQSARRCLSSNIPCYANGETQDYGDLVPDPQHTSVTKLDSQGHLLANVTGGGITLPWGLAVDGAGNVWVANFAGQRLSHINGLTVQPIAPHGYPNDGLVRNTGVTIDSSGNVWLANNWLQDPVQTNPGGDAAVVFIGLAAPVKTPMLGPPQQP
jgi:hypothetical protein